MKTQSIFAIAIEALVIVSLIALLGLLTALIYVLLSFLGTESTPQSLLTDQIQTPEVTTNPVLPATTLALPSAKVAPKLEVAVKEAKTEIIAEVSTKPIAKMTLQELRPLARERQIPNWRKLKKKELIFYLTM